jgi:hypothetical protein
MTDVIQRLVTAMNAHDLDAAAGLIHETYQSAQPAHPSRAFVGRAQMRANWEAMFAGIPDFYAEIRVPAQRHRRSPPRRGGANSHHAVVQAWTRLLTTLLTRTLCPMRAQLADATIRVFARMLGSQVDEMHA